MREGGKRDGETRFVKEYMYPLISVCTQATPSTIPPRNLRQQYPKPLLNGPSNLLSLSYQLQRR